MRRLLVIGGAVLVLAACDNATAPTLSRHEGPAASSAAKKTPTVSGGTSQSSTLDIGGCTIWLKQGDTDSVAVPCDYQ